MQVTFKNVGRNSMTWVAEMRPPTEQKMLAAIAHRGALLSRNITLEHDISNDQKFAICAGVRVVGLIYLGNALAVEQAREQSVESAQPLYPRKIQTQDDTENDRQLRDFSSSSTAQQETWTIIDDTKIDPADPEYLRAWRAWHDQYFARATAQTQPDPRDLRDLLGNT